MASVERPASLPWWPADRPARVGEPLSRARIVEAALRIIDAEGLEALSMRRLGVELGAGATSVYWHVRSKDQLLDLVLDEIIGQTGDEVRPEGDWREQLADAAHALRRVLLRHSNAVQMLGARLTLGPNTLDAMEWLLGSLAEGGFDRTSAVATFNAVFNLTAGWAILESRSPVGPPPDPATAEEVNAALAGMLRELPPDRFPNLVATAEEMTIASEDDLFDFALERLLDGIAANR